MKGEREEGLETRQSKEGREMSDQWGRSVGTNRSGALGKEKWVGEDDPLQRQGSEPHNDVYGK